MSLLGKRLMRKLLQSEDKKAYNVVINKENYLCLKLAKKRKFY